MTTPPNEYPGNRSDCRRRSDNGKVSKNRDARIEENIPTSKHRAIAGPLSNADAGNNREHYRQRKRNP